MEKIIKVETGEDLRPRIKKIQEVKDLANRYKTTPTSIVNFLVDVGTEVLKRGADEIETKYRNKLRDLLK